MDQQSVLWARLVTGRTNAHPRGLVSAWKAVRFDTRIELEAALDRLGGMHERVILPPGLHPEGRVELTPEQLPPGLRAAWRETGNDEQLYRELGGEGG